MSKYWTLSVEHFGKIRTADIEVAPLTFFLGENNSGKSFLMNLFWCVNGNACSKIAGKERQCDIQLLMNMVQRWMEQHPKSHDGKLISFNMTEKEHRVFLEAINHIFELHCSDWISNLFLADNLSAEKLRIDFSLPERCRIEIAYFNKAVPEPRFRFSFQSNKEPLVFSGCPARSALDIGLAQAIAMCYFGNFCNTGNTIFLPSPRTGYVLTRKALEWDSLPEEDSHIVENPLVFSHRRFLEMLSWFSKDNSPQERISKIVHFIEDEIIDGQIVLGESGPEMWYKPNGSEQVQPIHLSSGAVTEIAPLIGSLKYNNKYWTQSLAIYFEEPEMGLHPKLQRQIARALIKLVNAGVQVCVSTHSDLIVQHLNDMIGLANRSEDREKLREEYGYDEDDVISPEQVRMYHFDVDPNDRKTDVRKIECSENGFIVPGSFKH